MDDIFSSLSAKDRDKLRKSSFPDWTSPQLATLTDKRFSKEDWIFERKLDGERCLSYIESGTVNLYSRNEKKLNIKYPELVEFYQNHLSSTAVIDGEIVAFENNISSFSKLQKRMHVSSEEEALESDIDIYYYVFDLMYLEGYNLTDLPLRARKSLLKDAVDFEDPVRFLNHRNEEGEKFFKEACKKGWEGIIAKDATASYVQSRSKKWLKFKCVNQQELVIGGYTEPEGERIGFGALLLGFYDDSELIYTGKVGTGFDDDTLKSLKNKLKKIEKNKPAYSGEKDLPANGVHWVEPELVAEIGFEEWTKNDKLRQPRYLGLRDDMDAKDVQKETPK